MGSGCWEGLWRDTARDGRQSRSQRWAPGQELQCCQCPNAGDGQTSHGNIKEPWWLQWWVLAAVTSAAPRTSVSGCHRMGQKMHGYQELAENVKRFIRVHGWFPEMLQNTDSEKVCLQLQNRGVLITQELLVDLYLQLKQFLKELYHYRTFLAAFSHVHNKR